MKENERVEGENGNEIEVYQNEYTVIPHEELMKMAENLDTKKISEEILMWLTKNVPHYVDNTVNVYKVPLDDLDVKEGTGKDELPMTETIKLQDLYRGIDENDSNAQEAREMLDAVCENIIETIPSIEGLGKELFEAITFFYQMPDVSNGQREKALAIDADLKEMGVEFEKLQKTCEADENDTDSQKAFKNLLVKIQEKIAEGNALLEFEEMKGKVVISKFDYEAFTVGVEIKSGSYDIAGNAIPEEQREVLKQYVMPEGFVIWFQLVFQDDEILPTSLF